MAVVTKTCLVAEETLLIDKATLTLAVFLVTSDVETVEPHWAM